MRSKDRSHEETHWCFFLFSLLLESDVADFDGRSSLLYRFNQKTMSTLKDVISLKFKSMQGDGVLFHGEGQRGDHITLELQKGRLALYLNLGKVISMHMLCIWLLRIKVKLGYPPQLPLSFLWQSFTEFAAYWITLDDWQTNYNDLPVPISPSDTHLMLEFEAWVDAAGFLPEF